MKKDSKIQMDRILRAAQDLFGLYGLSKTTMQEIASNAGMSKASLYYYFQDKESVFRAVAAMEQDNFVKQMKSIIQNEKEVGRMLLGYTRLRIELMGKLLTLGKFSYDTYIESKPVFKSLHEDFRKKS